MDSIFKNPAWKRLKKNKGAVAGLVVIIIAVFTAVLCYFIAPDGSPYSNRIILEIGGEKPGTEKQLLQVKKEAYEPANFFRKLFYGQPDAYHFVPINKYSVKGDSIIAEKYIDEGVSERISFAKSALANRPVTSKTYWVGTDS